MKATWFQSLQWLRCARGRTSGFPQITIIPLAKQLPHSPPAVALSHHNNAPLPTDTWAQWLALTVSLKSATVLCSESTLLFRALGMRLMSRYGTIICAIPLLSALLWVTVILKPPVLQCSEVTSPYPNPLVCEYLFGPSSKVFHEHHRHPDLAYLKPCQ